ncbi:MAG: acyltransferase family protein [Parafannyhessea sp.]|uniref:acyltransferase family protein n=1 Tax=Parafannyhessea sp. TaxID=2847324 RepID=UPI003F03461A
MAGGSTRRGTAHVTAQPARAAQPQQRRQQRQPERPASGKRYVTSLDGLRAICALGVVFYHMGLSWCGGGLLGVTVLFVLSGYLATAGLLSELRRSGTIRLGSYWLRRIKRLLPTCIAFVIVTAALCTALDHQLLTKMRPDIVPALLMVLNWAKILRHESYFAAAGAPSPLTHFWSLAIEFQFYLVWPVVLLLAMRASRTRAQARNARDGSARTPERSARAQAFAARLGGHPAIVIGLALGTIASAVAMALLYVPQADPSRAYYGTDTRCQSLLLGSLLAFVWPFGEKSQSTVQGGPAWRRPVAELAAAGSVVALVWLMATTEGYTSFSYYGGILLCSAISAVAIAALVPYGTVTERVLSVKSLAWVGSRSFAIYIWHYPIVELMQPRNATLAPPAWQVLLELAIVLAAAELSYRLVEEPLRKGSVAQWFRELARPVAPAVAAAAARPESAAGRQGEGRPSRPMRREATPRATLRQGSPRGTGAARNRRDRQHDAAPQGRLVALGHALARTPRGVLPAAVCLVAVLGLALVPAQAAVGGAPEAQRVSSATLLKPLTSGTYDVVLIGDSVSLGAKDAFNAAFPYGIIDAKVGRQASAALDTYKAYGDKGVVGDTVIFSIGSNGALTQGDLDAIYKAVGTRRKIWFVNNRVPKAWCSANNSLLKSFSDAHKNVGLIDWYSYSSGHDDWFWDDGTHLRPQYAQNLIDLIVKTTGYVKPTRQNTTYSAVVLGDATTAAASEELSALMPQAMIDCATGRDADACAKSWKSYVKASTAGDVAVIDPDDGSPFDEKDVDAILDAIGSKVTVYVVTGRSQAPYCKANNAAIKAAAKGRKNVTVVDWYKASAGHDAYLSSDGASLTKAGRTAYARLVAAAVKKSTATSSTTTATSSSSTTSPTATAATTDASTSAAA